ncbi:IS630 transposase-related protein [Prosthecochloris sp. SCSIO W1101]|uniref:transposase n=1 Tax=Prosthecochloris sp. SCSIO W1101 TaxID=2992242 RepID=UPI00223CDF91|nr:transposase [Prosthecochloris sp. SCSIO W1101]UZJ40842.1 IS630 transposase-related protein [Prosthecochloris sp. SCSIO W1101]
MGVNKRYSAAFKQKVVSEIENGKFSVGEAHRVYEIGGGTTIYNWLRRYGKGHLINKTVVVKMKNESDRIKQLEKEKRELEAALAKTQVRVVVLESLIDAAEQELKIDIKKKSGIELPGLPGKE